MFTILYTGFRGLTVRITLMYFGSCLFAWLMPAPMALLPQEVKILNDGSTISTGTNDTGHLAVGDGVKTIGKAAFSSSQLTSIDIPSSVTSIEDSAFLNNQLTKVSLPKALYNERINTFDESPGGLKFYEYNANRPDSEESVGSRACQAICDAEGCESRLRCLIQGGESGVWLGLVTSI